MDTAKRIVWVISGLILAAGNLAGAQETEPAEELPRYQVELLVFRNLDQSGTTAEIPRMPEAEIADILDQGLAEGIALRTESGSATELHADGLPVSEQYWQEAAPEELRLGDIASRLERLQAYDLLAHLGWQQTAPDVSVAMELDFAQLGVDPAFISGHAKFFSRRYLHLALDVELPDDARSGGGFQTFSSSAALPAIKDSRRIRLEELHYFDQPQLGVIAMVSRVEETAE
jgi:hypothetical protein